MVVAVLVKVQELAREKTKATELVRSYPEFCRGAEGNVSHHYRARKLQFERAKIWEKEPTEGNTCCQQGPYNE